MAKSFLERVNQIRETCGDNTNYDFSMAEEGMLPPEDIEKIIAALKDSQGNHSVDLNMQMLETQAINELINMLVDNKNSLTSFDLSATGFTEENLSVLTDNLLNLRKNITLNISNNSIDEASLLHFLSKLNEIPEGICISLKLHGLNITDDMVKSLEENLKKIQCALTLDLSDNSLGEAAALTLISILQENKNITIINNTVHPYNQPMFDDFKNAVDESKISEDVKARIRFTLETPVEMSAICEVSNSKIVELEEKLEQKKQKLQKTRETIEGQKAKITTLESEKENLNKDLQTEKVKVTVVEKEKESLDKDLVTEKEKTTRLEKDKVALSKDIQKEKANFSNLKGENENLTNIIGAKEENINRLKEDILKLEATIKRLLSIPAPESVGPDPRIEQLQKELSEKVVELEKALQEVEEYKNKISIVEGKKGDLERQVREHLAEIERKTAELKIASDKINQKKEKISEKNHEILTLNNQLSHAKQRFSELEIALEEKNKQFINLREQWDNSENTNVDYEKIIADMRLEIIALDKDLEKTKSYILKLKNKLTEKKQEIQRLNHDLQQVKEQVVEKEQEVKNRDRFLTQAGELIKELEDEEKTLTAKVVEYKQLSIDQDHILSQADELIEYLGNETSKKDGLLFQGATHIVDLEILLGERAAEIITLNSELEKIKNNVYQLTILVDEREKEISDLNSRLDVYLSSNVELKAVIEVKSQEVLDLNELLSGYKRNIFKIENLLDCKIEEIQHLEKNLNDAKENNILLQKKVIRLESEEKKWTHEYQRHETVVSKLQGEKKALELELARRTEQKLSKNEIAYETALLDMQKASKDFSALEKSYNKYKEMADSLITRKRKGGDLEENDCKLLTFVALAHIVQLNNDQKYKNEFVKELQKNYTLCLRFLKSTTPPKLIYINTLLPILGVIGKSKGLAPLYRSNLKTLRTVLKRLLNLQLVSEATLLFNAIAPNIDTMNHTLEWINTFISELFFLERSGLSILNAIDALKDHFVALNIETSTQAEMSHINIQLMEFYARNNDIYSVLELLKKYLSFDFDFIKQNLPLGRLTEHDVFYRALFKDSIVNDPDTNFTLDNLFECIENTIAKNNLTSGQIIKLEVLKIHRLRVLADSLIRDNYTEEADIRYTQILNKLSQLNKDYGYIHHDITPDILTRSEDPTLFVEYMRDNKIGLSWLNNPETKQDVLLYAKFYVVMGAAILSYHPYRNTLSVEELNALNATMPYAAQEAALQEANLARQTLEEEKRGLQRELQTTTLAKNSLETRLHVLEADMQHLKESGVDASTSQPQPTIQTPIKPLGPPPPPGAGMLPPDLTFKARTLNIPRKEDKSASPSTTSTASPKADMMSELRARQAQKGSESGSPGKSIEDKIAESRREGNASSSSSTSGNAKGSLMEEMKRRQVELANKRDEKEKQGDKGKSVDEQLAENKKEKSKEPREESAFNLDLLKKFKNANKQEESDDEENDFDSSDDDSPTFINNRNRFGEIARAPDEGPASPRSRARNVIAENGVVVVDGEFQLPEPVVVTQQQASNAPPLPPRPGAKK